MLRKSLGTTLKPPLLCNRLTSSSPLRHASTSTPSTASQPSDHNKQQNCSTGASASPATKEETLQEIKEKKKTLAELDEELKLKLEEMSGEGGAAGLELEGGKPVAMKRGVRENMFRLI